MAAPRRIWPSLATCLALLFAFVHAAAGGDLPAATAGCTTSLDSSSAMLGAPWRPSFSLTTHEMAWAKGAAPLTSVSLYYGDGCIQGIRAAYGDTPAGSKLLGMDVAADGTGLAAVDLQLSRGERFVAATYTVGNCLEHLKLTTSLGRELVLGNTRDGVSTHVSKPKAPGGFLAYLKAYTTTPSPGGTAGGRLAQLQFVWALQDCPDAGTFPDQPAGTPPPPAVAAPVLAGEVGVDRTPPAPQQPAPTQAGSSSPAEVPVHASQLRMGRPVQHVVLPVAPESARLQYVGLPVAASRSRLAADIPYDGAAAGGQAAADAAASSTSSSSSSSNGSGSSGSSTSSSVITTQPAMPSSTSPCKPTNECSRGHCLTSSCALNGMGKDVLSMACFGTNIVPNPVLDLTVGNPCVNLACKLDKQGCVSAGLMGVGGFCAGRVVAMGATAKLHPSGKAFLGYPCVEHKGPVLDLVPPLGGDYSARGTYIAKAWKVCDCIQGLGLNAASLPNNGSSLRLQMAHFPTDDVMLPSSPKLPVYSMSARDVAAQWMAGLRDNITLPRLDVSDAQLAALRELMPSLHVPALLVTKQGAALLQLPDGFVPRAFTIPDTALARVQLVLPALTSLPSLLTAPGGGGEAAGAAAALRLQQVVVANFMDIARQLGVVDKLPSLDVTIPNLPVIINQLSSQAGVADIGDVGMADIAGLMQSLSSGVAGMPGGVQLPLNLTKSSLRQVNDLLSSFIDSLPDEEPGDEQAQATPAASSTPSKAHDSGGGDADGGGVELRTADASTAFMDPKEFNALPKEQQKAMLALFGS